MASSAVWRREYTPRSYRTFRQNRHTLLTAKIATMEAEGRSTFWFLKDIEAIDLAILLSNTFTTFRSTKKHNKFPAEPFTAGWQNTASSHGA